LPVPLVGADRIPRPLASLLPLVRPKTRVPWRFDLRSIMLLVLVIGLGLGLSLQYQTAGLGIPILILGPATVIRAAPILVERKRKGRPTGVSAVLGVIGESLGVVLVLVVSSMIAFVAVCFPMGYATIMVRGLDTNAYAYISLGAGTIAVLAVLYFRGRRTFPPKD